MKFKIAISTMQLRKKLPKGDARWEQLTGSFVNREVDSLELANAIYTGHAFCPWLTQPWRNNENFMLAQFIAIDIDTEDERSALATLERHTWVRLYASFVYTTPSHTPEAPRARVVFLLDEPITDAEGYKAAKKFVAGQFDGADPSCSDASRAYNGSYQCESLFPDNVLPLAHLRSYYARWKAAQPKPRPQAPRNYERKPEDFDKAAEALQQVDPYSVDYNRWIGIIAAMKREFGDAALPVVERWAQGRQGEVAREWERLRTDHRKAMHLGTIFHLAKH